MKKLLIILGAVSLTASGASSVIACGGGKKINNKPITKKENNDDIKILEEYINNTSLDNIKNSTINNVNKEAHNESLKLIEIENEYKDKFKTNHKNIDFQLFVLFFLRRTEADFKWMGVQFEKKIPPDKNDVRIHLYKIIEQIKKGVFNFEKKEYKINHLLVKLANELEKKYFL